MDIPTLFVVLYLSYLANILFALVLSFGGNTFPGSRLWITAQFLASLGTLVMVFRDQVPFLIIAAGNTLLFASSLLYAHSAWRFRFRTHFPHWFYLFLVGFALVFTTLEQESVNIRTALISAAMASASIWTSLLFIKNVSRPFLFASWVTGLPFLLYFGFYIFQAINTLLSPQIFIFRQQSTAYTITLLLSILTASVSLFGYYLLAGVWKQENLEKTSRKLLTANQELQKSNQNTNFFVSMLAHDLCAPITGAARYMRKHVLSEDVDIQSKRQGLEVLALSLEKTQIFLENVPWWSRLQREDWAQKRDFISLDKIAQSVLDRLRPGAEEKKQKFKVTLSSTRVYADADSIEMILQNLVSNAIKFSHHESEIEIETGFHSKKVAFFRVTDQGVGIPAEIREKLFQIDQKVITQGTNGEFGTGLGLILCLEFAQVNSAHLLLTSHPGLGTTVILSFDPVQAPVALLIKE